MRRRLWLIPMLLTFALLAMGQDSCDTTTTTDFDNANPPKKKKDGGSGGGGVPPPIVGGTGGDGGGDAAGCDPNYEGDCVPVNASDVDCAGGTGDGPEYVGPVQVVGTDTYGLDRDGDGYACE